MTDMIDWWFLYVNSKCHEENKPEFLSSKAESIPYFINYQFEITPIFWVDVSQFSNRLVIVVGRNSDLKLGISFLAEHLSLGLMSISCTVYLKISCFLWKVWYVLKFRSNLNDLIAFLVIWTFIRLTVIIQWDLVL